MDKYDKNLGYYYLKQRFESYYFNKELLNKLDRGFFKVALVKKDEDELEKNLGLQKIYLSVAHPGLLIGTGTTLEFTPIETEDKTIKYDNYKIGMSFDYTSGLPYIPGSSIKGVLSSFFPEVVEDKKDEKELAQLVERNQAKAEIINAILNKNFSVEELQKLAMAIFEGRVSDKSDKAESFLPIYKRDKFIEGRIVIRNKEVKVLDRDYITPHRDISDKKDILDNPVPLELLKIAPKTEIELLFQLNKTSIDGLELDVEEKLNLFREILFLTGLGAKSNTGYGHFIRKE